MLDPERAATGTLYLDEGMIDPNGYMGMWQALVAWERDRFEAGHPIYVGEFRAKLTEIAGDRPDMIAAFAVNTTRLGRPLNETTGLGGLEA